MNNSKIAPRLNGYLTASIIIGCLGAQADAAITITPVNADSASFGNLDISFSTISAGRHIANFSGLSNASIGKAGTPGINVDNLSAGRTSFNLGAYTGIEYYNAAYSGFIRGGSFGDQNFLLTTSTSGTVSSVAELDTVIQFDFDGAGGGSIVAIANMSGGIDFGEAVEALNSVPEPSSLALLALGSTGLLARRRRAAA